MSNGQSDSIAPNAKRLLWAGFMAILAAGAGFGIRGGIFDNWGTEFGFNAGQLGAIGGAGFSGFCFGIIIGGVVADKIGYGKLVIAAFAFHVLSAFVTFAAVADPTIAGAPPPTNASAYSFLYWGMFIFALANGTLEAVANPLVATLFPHNRTHYLNILHSSWPAGLVFGGVVGWVLDDQMKVNWKIQLACYLLPTVIYGLMFFGQHMPKSEASKKGLSLGEMFKDVGILGALVVCYLLSLFFSGALGLDPKVSYGISGVLLVIVAIITRGSLGSFLLFTLFVAHLLIGAVELGTDGWIQNITGNILTSEQGKILFVYTSFLMMALRFTVDFIEKKTGISPMGILLTCSILAAVGLKMVSGISTFTGAFIALSVYAVGKTFFWPTMLAVASDRFPRTGAIAISIMGGIGMMSAGMVGSPGLGYAKDRFAGEALQQADAALYTEYKSATASKFLIFEEVHGLDGKKLGEVQGRLDGARGELAKAGNTDPAAAIAKISESDRKVHDASISGDRKTLVADMFIPLTMAAIYLCILLYFKAIGGYKTVHIVEEAGAKQGSA